MAKQQTLSDEELGLALNNTLYQQGSQGSNHELHQLYGSKPSMNENEEREIKTAIGADIRTGNIYEAIENLSDKSKLQVQDAIGFVKQQANGVDNIKAFDERIKDAETIAKKDKVTGRDAELDALIARTEMLIKGRQGVPMTSMAGATIHFNEKWNNAQIVDKDGSTIDISGKEEIKNFAEERKLTAFETKTLNEFDELGASIRDPDGSIEKARAEYMAAEDKRRGAIDVEVNEYYDPNAKLNLELENNAITNSSALDLDAATKTRLAQNRAADTANATESLKGNGQTVTVDNSKFNDDAKSRTNDALKKQEDEVLRKRIERETMLAMQGNNSVDLVKKGREITRDEMIMPRAISQSYNEQDGKFFAKDGNRLMFEDKGTKLTTSTEDKKAISDMVVLAKAKQWDSLKLSGSVDFRREVWLQAESQGIKTSGYTPKEADLSALKTLTAERSTNAITPLQERKAQDLPLTNAPRHDLNKNQAEMHNEATKNIASNLKELQANPKFAGKSMDDLNKLAFWRGIVQEENKYSPPEIKGDAVARFDSEAHNPQFLAKIKSQTEGSIDDKTTDRVKTRDTHEHTR